MARWRRARCTTRRTIRRLTSGPFPVFQLDATAYPGNSGSPIYDPVTGDVLGIVNMVFVKGTKESALTQPSGITYAIPAKHLQVLEGAGLVDRTVVGRRHVCRLEPGPLASGLGPVDNLRIDKGINLVGNGATVSVSVVALSAR